MACPCDCSWLQISFYFSFGSIGERRGQPAVDWPACIAIDDNSKNVAVADLMNGVRLFSAEGRYVRDIGRPVTRGVHGVRSPPPPPPTGPKGPHFDTQYPS